MEKYLAWVSSRKKGPEGGFSTFVWVAVCVCVAVSLSLRWSAAAAAFSFPKGPYSAALQQRERTAPVNNTACESRREAVGGGGRYGCGLCSKRPWCKGRLKLFRMPVGIQLRRGLVLVPPLFDTLRKKTKTIFIFFYLFFLLSLCERVRPLPHTQKRAATACFSIVSAGDTQVCALTFWTCSTTAKPLDTRGKKRAACVCVVYVCVVRH